VEDGGADQLDVEIAHPDRTDAGLPDHREDVGRTSSRGVLEDLQLVLAARLRQLAAALEVGMGELVLGRLAGVAACRISPRGSARTARDLVIGECVDLGSAR